MHVVSDAPASKLDYRHGDILELRKPDGSTLQTSSNIVLIDSQEDYPLVVSLPDLNEQSVTVGTEVWLADVERKSLKPSRHWQPAQ